MKKILYFIDSFPSYSETFLYNQIYFLIDNGFDVEIVAFKKRDGLSGNIHQKMFDYNLAEKCYFLNHNISINLLFNFLLFPYLCFKVFKLMSIKKSFFVIRNLKTLNNFSKYDIIHAHYGNVGAFVSDLKSIGFFHNVRIVCSFHGEDVSHKASNVFEKKYKNIGEYADVVTVNSQYTYDCLINSVGVFWSNIEILPVPVDTNYFKPLLKENINSDCFNIIFCGRLIELKAPLFAIEIVNQLIQRGYKANLTIVGDGPEYSKCLNLIDSFGLNEFIKMAGFVSQEKLLPFYQSSHIFLFPGIKESKTNKSEAQGLVLQEAQAVGLPVVVSDVGGIKYGMKNSDTGFLIKEKDLDEFVNKIVFLIDHPQELSLMSLKARDFVIQNFDINFLGEKLLSFYGC